MHLPDLLRRTHPVLLVVALGLVVLLGWQNRDLVERNQLLSRRLNEPMPGGSVPTFSSHTLEGTLVTLGESNAGSRQVLFVFTTTCPYCKASLPAWKSLSARFDSVRTSGGPNVELYGISLDSLIATERYVRDHGLPFPVTQFPSAKLRRLYKAKSVPLAIVLDGDGRILYSRLGALALGPAADSLFEAVTRARPARRMAFAGTH